MFKSEIVCKSEIIEPAVAHIIGVYLNRISELKDKPDEELGYPYDKYREDLILKECSDLWYAMEAIFSLSVAAKGAVHFNMAFGNEYRNIAGYIEHLTGIDPMNTDDCMFNFKG